MQHTLPGLTAGDGGGGGLCQYLGTLLTPVFASTHRHGGHVQIISLYGHI